MRRARTVEQDEVVKRAGEDVRAERLIDERGKAARDLAAALHEESRALEAQAQLQLDRAKRIVEGEVTPREREVLKLVALGHTNKEIAATLSLSVRTVEMHRRRGMGRIGAKRVSDVVQWAISHRLLEP